MPWNCYDFQSLYDLFSILIFVGNIHFVIFSLESGGSFSIRSLPIVVSGVNANNFFYQQPIKNTHK